MGNKVVTFTEEQLEAYQDCTFFTRKEILRAQKRFRSISPDQVPKSMTKEEASSITVPFANIEKLPELKENPFKMRICEIFSRDGSGNLAFEDFLDMFSIFSEQASRDIKVFYAFKIYGIDMGKLIHLNLAFMLEQSEKAAMKDKRTFSFCGIPVLSVGPPSEFSLPWLSCHGATTAESSAAEADRTALPKQRPIQGKCSLPKKERNSSLPPEFQHTRSARKRSKTEPSDVPLNDVAVPCWSTAQSFLTVVGNVDVSQHWVGSSAAPAVPSASSDPSSSISSQNQSKNDLDESYGQAIVTKPRDSGNDLSLRTSNNLPFSFCGFPALSVGPPSEFSLPWLSCHEATAAESSVAETDRTAVQGDSSFPSKFQRTRSARKRSKTEPSDVLLNDVAVPCWSTAQSFLTVVGDVDVSQCWVGSSAAPSVPSTSSDPPSDISSQRVKKNDPDESAGILTPEWRVNDLAPIFSVEGTEDVSDAAFERAHARLELDEKRRKKLDDARMREQLHEEHLRERELARGKVRAAPANAHAQPVESFFPDPRGSRDDLRLLVSDTLPISFCGIPVPSPGPPVEFSLPWLRQVPPVSVNGSDTMKSCSQPGAKSVGRKHV